MKLYIADGTYCGTQAEAKAISKQFEAVDVPVDKAGLIAYLNNAALAVAAETVADTVVALNTPSNIAEAFTAQTPFDLDTAFERAPLRQRLRLAVTAIDAAEAAIPEAWSPGDVGSNPCSEVITSPEPAEEQPDLYGDLL